MGHIDRDRLTEALRREEQTYRDTTLPATTAHDMDVHTGVFADVVGAVADG